MNAEMDTAIATLVNTVVAIRTALVGQGYPVGNLPLCEWASVIRSYTETTAEQRAVITTALNSEYSALSTEIRNTLVNNGLSAMSGLNLVNASSQIVSSSPGVLSGSDSSSSTLYLNLMRCSYGYDTDPMDPSGSTVAATWKDISLSGFDNVDMDAMYLCSDHELSRHSGADNNCCPVKAVRLRDCDKITGTGVTCYDMEEFVISGATRVSGGINGIANGVKLKTISIDCVNYDSDRDLAYTLYVSNYCDTDMSTSSPPYSCPNLKTINIGPRYRGNLQFDWPSLESSDHNRTNCVDIIMPNTVSDYYSKINVGYNRDTGECSTINVYKGDYATSSTPLAPSIPVHVRFHSSDPLVNESKLFG